MSVYDATSATMQQQQTLDQLVNSLIQERNALRAQNEQLWKVVERQKQHILSLEQASGNSKRAVSAGRQRQSSAQQQNLPYIPPSRGSSSNQSLQQNKGYFPPVNNLGYQQPALGAASDEQTTQLVNVDLRSVPSIPSPDSRLPKVDLVGSEDESDIMKEINRLQLQYASQKTESSGSFPPEQQENRESVSSLDSSRPSEARKDPHNESHNRRASETRRSVLERQNSRPRSPSKSPERSQEPQKPTDPQQSPARSRKPSFSLKQPLHDIVKKEEDEHKEDLLDENAASQQPHTVIDHDNQQTVKDQEWHQEDQVTPETLKDMTMIRVNFIDTSMRSRKGKEVVCLIFSISNPAGSIEYWRCEKAYAELFVLDMKLKQSQPQSFSAQLGKIPDKSLFTDNSPERQAIRKQALETYIYSAIAILPTDEELISFFASNIAGKQSTLEHQNSHAIVQKEGYLTKKGKGFGGYTWKKRYFVLKNGLIDCFETLESSNGPSTGTIKLKYCTVSAKSGTESDPEYKFAFCITEYKKGAFTTETPIPPDSKINCKYVLHASEQSECDSWIQCIQINIDAVRPIVSADNQGKAQLNSDGMITPEPSESLSEKSPESIAQAPQPPSISRPSSPSRPFVPSSPPGGRPGKIYVDEGERIMKQAVSPLASIFDFPSSASESAKSLPLKATNSVANVKQKKPDNGKKRMTSFFTSKKKSTGMYRNNSLATLPEPSAPDPNKFVFGVTLKKAVSISRITDTYELPAVIYRCIEYLDGKDAILEEGIFRLSGSSSEIQKLRDKFNSEPDVDLLGSGEFYDVHAVAGLLKLWFRELTSPVLTSEMQHSFLELTELPERELKVVQLKKLVARLPRANYTLLRALMGHLIRVVQNQSVNKMTVRNVGIVFAPTLSLPAGVFTLLMSEYSNVFKWDGLPDDEVDRSRFGNDELIESESHQNSNVPENKNEDDNSTVGDMQPRKRTKQIDKSRRVQIGQSTYGEYDDLKIEAMTEEAKIPVPPSQVERPQSVRRPKSSKKSDALEENVYSSQEEEEVVVVFD